MPKYVIASDEYMGLKPKMYSTTQDSFRELLLVLLDLKKDEVFDEPFLIGERMISSPADMTDDDLLTWFDDANGDGQPFTVAFDVDADKQVLG